MRRRSRQIRVQSGQFEFVKLNAKKFDWRDTYHFILTLSWPAFAGVVFGIYLLINFVFALLYLLHAHAVAEMPTGSFLCAFLVPQRDCISVMWRSLRRSMECPI